MYEVFVKLAQENGVTAYKVAKATGISQQTFTDWKNGRSVPKADKLQKIADYFGVTVDYLMTGKSNTSNEPTEDDIRIALFDGDKDVTPEMWEEVKNYAKYVLQNRKNYKFGNNKK